METYGTIHGLPESPDGHVCLAASFGRAKRLPLGCPEWSTSAMIVPPLG